MKFESKNIYVLNKKDKTAIVYEDSEGNIIRLTCDMFSSEDEFRKFKKWSDKNYHKAEKERHIQSNHTLSFDVLTEDTYSVKLFENQQLKFQEVNKREQVKHLIIEGLDICLTKKQKDRLWLYYVDGLNEKAIAILEGVKQQSISRTIKTGRNKIVNYLLKQGVKMPF